ncbi:MAG: transglutaminase domain-containing protein [Candidatus Dormibacteria bacterium]
MVHQQLRYEYPGPIHDLNHRLVIIPPERFGDQRRLEHRVGISFRSAETSIGVDSFGNVVVDVRVPVVRRVIAFNARIVLERRAAELMRVPRETWQDRRLLEFTPLTMPDAALRRAARSLLGGGERGLALAERINRYVFATMRYQPRVTGVKTTAAHAYAMGHGVCQDYAHVMLTLCRLAGLPARYVSGHLIGEGASHAWVEAVLPLDDGGSEALVVPFDPTHGRRATLGYLTVALGRDYADVAPTSGSFRAAHGGELSSRRRVTLTEVEYGRMNPPAASPG